MVRTKTHKFIFNATDISELYDLARDPHEQRNVIKDPAYATVKEELKERLLTYLKDTQDRSAFRMEFVFWDI